MYTIIMYDTENKITGTVVTNIVPTKPHTNTEIIWHEDKYDAAAYLAEKNITHAEWNIPDVNYYLHGIITDIDTTIEQTVPYKTIQDAIDDIARMYLDDIIWENTAQVTATDVHTFHRKLVIDVKTLSGNCYDNRKEFDLVDKTGKTITLHPQEVINASKRIFAEKPALCYDE